MTEYADAESGYVADAEDEFGVRTEMTEVEVLRLTKTNVIARGIRYGRRWMLKGLRPELRDSSSHKRQLQKEFEIHSRLHNQAIVQAVGFEEIEGLGWCIVEEWVEGKTLFELLREGTLSKKDRNRIMREIIGAAGYLHQMGVVHRDLKPSNVMVRAAGGSVVLIDFGLADTADYVELKQGAGTSGYLSPEQEANRAANPSDDIYSLGVIIRELCPDYLSIARKCTGHINKRPRDTEALLRLIDRKDRRPKNVLRVSMVVLVICAFCLVIVRLVSISHASKESQKQLAVTRQATLEASKQVDSLREENQRQTALLGNLSDSLSIMTTNVSVAKERLKASEEYEIVKTKAYEEGCRLVDKLLRRYDKEIFPNYSELCQEYNDSYKAMMDEAMGIVDNSCTSTRYASIKAADRERIRTSILDYYMQQSSKYQKKWLSRLAPEFYKSDK